MNPRDPCVQMAQQILNHLGVRTATLPAGLRRDLHDLLKGYEAVQRTGRMMDLAHGRRWDLSAEKLRQELFQQVRSLEYQIPEILRHEQAPAPPPILGTIHAELEQLKREFDEVDILPDRGLIVVRTEAIVLEGVELGPFAIELHIGRLAEHQ